MSISNLSFDELEREARRLKRPPSPKPAKETKEQFKEGTDTDVAKEKSPIICVVTGEIAASNPPPAQEVESKTSLTNNVSVSSASPSNATLAPADVAALEDYDKSYQVRSEKELKEKTLMFDTYIDLLAFFHSSIQNKDILLHKWQIETGNFISTYKATINNPLKFALCASNGSGKDSFCIAPLAVWFILCKLKSRVVITSSSGVQLTAQTETYIRNLCETINALMDEMGAPKAFKINQRYIRCLYTGSEIRMYATDEPGKAEGYHPQEPNAPFLIIVNEAKSVVEEIFQAISRCTGFSHKVYVSSPGEPKGSFHFACKSGLEKQAGWLFRRITSYDCTHIPRSEIQSDLIELGEHSALFRSKHLALFTSIGGQVVIAEDAINKCKQLAKQRIGANWPKRVGIDLAAGGDECVIDICQGNKGIFHYEFIERDTTITAEIINRELVKQGIPKDSTFIRADDGGVGRGIIDQLVRPIADGGKFGWNIKRMINQSPAYNKRMYGNLGAEMWFKYCRLIEECLWLLDEDEQNNPKLVVQLAARHYKQTTGGNNRLYLQAKSDAKAEGHPSPDRADARVLANSDLSVEDFLDPKSQEPNLATTKNSLTTLQDVVDTQEQQKYAYANANRTTNDFHNAEMVKWSLDPDSIGQSQPTIKSRQSTSLPVLSDFI